MRVATSSLNLDERERQIREQKEKLLAILEVQPSREGLIPSARPDDGVELADDAIIVAPMLARLYCITYQKQQAERALCKLDEGWEVYTICSACDDPISVDRLLAVPEAICCTFCQEELDRGELFWRDVA